MNKELWKKCVDFHGHECPGLAIGFRAVELANQRMSIPFAQDEEVVCISENDACGVDAVQVLTGCTLGKGNLILKSIGKMAFIFINRKNGEALRVILNTNDEDMDRDEKQKYILEGPADKVFKIQELEVKLPEKARRFNTVVCEQCHEGAAENKIRVQDGKMVCLTCFSDYSRGW